MGLKYDAIGLITKGADSLRRKDGGTAFALYELADNLAIVMRGEATIEAFCSVYVGQDAPPFIRDGMMPGEKDYPLQATLKKAGAP